MDLASLLIESFILWLLSLVWTILLFAVSYFILKRFKKRIINALRELMIEVIFDIFKDKNYKE